VTEQRYRAVLQVQAGFPLTEVADQFGVSRQAVHRWLAWYRDPSWLNLVCTAGGAVDAGEGFVEVVG